MPIASSMINYGILFCSYPTILPSHYNKNQISIQQDSRMVGQQNSTIVGWRWQDSKMVGQQDGRIVEQYDSRMAMIGQQDGTIVGWYLKFEIQTSFSTFWAYSGCNYAASQMPFCAEKWAQKMANLVLKDKFTSNDVLSTSKQNPGFIIDNLY